MGGNLFKHLDVGRLPAKEYFEVANDVMSKLVPYTDQMALIPSYRNKESFGDIDILVVLSNPIISYKELFDTDIVHNNGGVISFPYRKIQIDLISVGPEVFNSSLTYFSYNDLGNLMGRIANWLSLSYGSTGLYLSTEYEGQSLKRIKVSTDTDKIFTFLGYDPKVFHRGFDDLEDIFKYVTSTKYFNPSIFSYDNLNHINRTRNRKRKTYQEFLNWLDKQVFPNPYIFSENKSDYLPMIKSYFPEAELDKHIQTIISDKEEAKRLKRKFNGDIIRELTGLEGRDIGECIFLIRKKVGHLSKWIEKSSEAEIHRTIKKYAKRIKETY